MWDLILSDACSPTPSATTFMSNVYLDTCHKSQAFEEAGVGLVMMQEACSNDNLWFGACSTAYKEVSDCHWLVAPLATSTTHKPSTLIQREIFL